jgi:hypothetical protein
MFHGAKALLVKVAPLVRELEELLRGIVNI